jgi:Domain of unknown function (DUF4279)
VIEWATASVRVSSETYSAAELTTLLGREPTKSFERGSLMSPCNPRSAKREASLWLLESELSRDAAVERHLEWALDAVETLREPIASLPAGSTDIFVGYELTGSQGGLVLDHALLQRLAALPVDLIFDLYSLDADEADEALA